MERVELVTVDGKTVRTETVMDKRHGIRTNELATGVYFVRLHFENGEVDNRKVFIR